MYTKTKIVEILHKNEDAIKAFGVKKVGIFGSFASSSQHSKSDIDVLVEFEEGSKTFDNYMDLKFYLERLFRRKVDLVIKDALKPRIKRQVISGAAYAGSKN